MAIPTVPAFPAIAMQESLPPATVWIDGRLTDGHSAAVPALDHSLLTGFGVFETLAVRASRPIALSRHLARLQSSADALGIAAPPNDTIQDAVGAVLDSFPLPNARLRITLTAGDSEGIPFHVSGPPRLIVSASPLPARQDTASLATAPWRKHAGGALSGIKSTSYGEQVRCVRHARNLGADEALILNTQGHICEGGSSNIWWIRDRVVHTPPVESGCLPGITRRLVMETCRRMGLQACESRAHPSTLLSADEVFLTSSLRDVQGVSRIDDTDLPPAPGEITSLLLHSLTAFLDANPDP